MRLRATIVAAIMTAAAGISFTAASPAFAATPSHFCAIVGAPAPGPNAASPILSQGCFSTKTAENVFVRHAIARSAPDSAVSPLASYHLGVAWSGENLSGSRYDFYGSNPGTCASGNYYQFANLNGPFDSAADDLASGANCEDAYYWSGSSYNGRDWDCSASFSGGSAYQSCGVRMPSGDDGAAHSVRFRS